MRQSLSRLERFFRFAHLQQDLGQVAMLIAQGSGEGRVPGIKAQRVLDQSNRLTKLLSRGGEILFLREAQPGEISQDQPLLAPERRLVGNLAGETLIFGQYELPLR